MNHRIRLLAISLAGFIPLQLYLALVWFPKFLSLSGGIPNLDSRSHYTATEVNTLLCALGAVGTRHYLFGAIIDLAYAFFMGLVVFSLYRAIQGRRISNKVIDGFSLAIPILYVLLDWTENAGIFIALFRFPNPVSTGVSFFSFCTQAKQLSPIPAGMFLVLLAIMRIRENRASARAQAAQV